MLTRLPVEVVSVIILIGGTSIKTFNSKLLLVFNYIYNVLLFFFLCVNWGQQTQADNTTITNPTAKINVGKSCFCKAQIRCNFTSPHVATSTNVEMLSWTAVSAANSTTIAVRWTWCDTYCRKCWCGFYDMYIFKHICVFRALPWLGERVSERLTSRAEWRCRGGW